MTVSLGCGLNKYLARAGESTGHGVGFTEKSRHNIKPNTD